MRGHGGGRRAQSEHEVVVVPGVPHSFFDRLHAEFQQQSDDAWRRTLAFIDSHSEV